jgi:hypothetical protein
MALDRQKVKDEFVEAMRTRLGPNGNNVDDAEVQQNFDALGWGVIRTLTQHAETLSGAEGGADLLAWAADVNKWLAALAAWQQGVTTAFSNWAPATGPEKTFRNAVLNVTVPGAPPASALTGLKGRIK